MANAHGIPIRPPSAITDRSLYTAQEGEKVPKVDGLIVPQGHMTAVGADGRGRIRHQRRHFTHVGRVHLVMILLRRSCENLSLRRWRENGEDKAKTSATLAAP